jgi:polyphosphate glucokinase
MASELNPKDLAIGLDFGGSGIKGAVVDTGTGELIGERLRVPTPQPSVPREVVVVMAALVQKLEEPQPAAASVQFPVGVGIPAAIRNGETITAANIDRSWIGFPAERELGVALHRTVAIGNDADLAGLAEMRFGAGKGQAGVVMVLTVGTGVGSALFVDGCLVPNTELGHLELDGKDAEIRAAESARDRLKLNWKEWAAGFDAYLHMLERLFYPDLFILGGGASKRADNYLPYVTVKTPIAVAAFRNNAGIVGGAIAAHERRDREAIRLAGEPSF